MMLFPLRVSTLQAYRLSRRRSLLVERLAVTSEVRNAGSVANEYRYSGFPLTTCGNDGKGEARMTGGVFVVVLAYAGNQSTDLEKRTRAKIPHGMLQVDSSALLRF